MIRPRGDDGNSVVDFTLVSVLVITLFLVVMQVAVVLHNRNVMVAAAAEGARYAANADRVPSDGVERTRELLAETFSEKRVDEMQVTLGQSGDEAGLETVEVVVEGPLPTLFFPVGPLRVTVRGHALEESRLGRAAG